MKMKSKLKNNYNLINTIFYLTFLTTRKKGFSEGYLAEVNITLEFNLINGGFFLKPQQNNGGFLTLFKFQRFILKPRQNDGGFFNLH